MTLDLENQLSTALKSLGNDITPRPRSLPQIQRRSSAPVIGGAAIMLVLGGVASLAVVSRSHRSPRPAQIAAQPLGPDCADAPATTSPCPTDLVNPFPKSFADWPVTSHGQYLFETSKQVYGSVIDSGEPDSNDGVVGTLVFYLTNHSKTPALESGIAQTGTHRVLPLDGYAADSSELQPGLHYADQIDANHVIAILNGPGTVTTDNGSPAQVIPFNVDALSLVLVHSDTTKTLSVAPGPDGTPEQSLAVENTH